MDILSKLMDNPGYEHLLRDILDRLSYDDLSALQRVNKSLKNYIENDPSLWRDFSVMERLLKCPKKYSNNRKTPGRILEKIFCYVDHKTVRNWSRVSKDWFEFIRGNLCIVPKEEQSLNLDNLLSIKYHLDRRKFMDWQRKDPQPGKVRLGCVSWYRKRYLIQRIKILGLIHPQNEMDDPPFVF